MSIAESRSSHVLVLSPDPVAAAFLGLFVELARLTPAFARDGERPEEAMLRVRPLAVVLLDGALDAARSDLFFAAAARERVGVAIFGPTRDVAPQAAERGVPCFAFPRTLAELERMLEEARASRWWMRAADRRQLRTVSHVEHGDAGALVYHDRRGRRWDVYDRRGSDRRKAVDPAPMERVFVSESGEEWRYALADGEAAARQPDELEAQLAQAVLVDA